MNEREMEVILSDGTVVIFRALWSVGKSGNLLTRGFVVDGANELPSCLFKEEALMWKALFEQEIKNKE